MACLPMDECCHCPAVGAYDACSVNTGEEKAAPFLRVVVVALSREIVQEITYLLRAVFLCKYPSKQLNLEGATIR